MRHFPLLGPFFLALPFAAFGQGDLAYMPLSAPSRTADDARIALHETDEEGIVELALPPGTYRLDLLNAQGNVVERFAPAEATRFDAGRLRPGTWTVRAWTPHGLKVRRFAVHQRNGANWVVEASPAGRRR